MTRTDALTCVHEPFGDAFYHGPERLSERYEEDEQSRLKSGYSSTTYKEVVEDLEEGDHEKRLFIKDMAYYLFPPDRKPARLVPSLEAPNGAYVNGSQATRAVHGTSEPSNPTVLPTSVLEQFHFTFLIRHPRRAIPSFWKCTVPPLRDVTGFSSFMPSEVGYDELRRLFDFLRDGGMLDPSHGGNSITVVDADDFLDEPERVIKAFCQHVDLDFSPDMLRWDGEEGQQQAAQLFSKWNGFHNDVLQSTSLKPRSNGVKDTTVEAEDEEWRSKFGAEAQKVIRKCVDENIPHYEYLRSFAL